MEKHLKEFYMPSGQTLKDFDEGKDLLDLRVKHKRNRDSSKIYLLGQLAYQLKQPSLLLPSKF